MLINHVTVIMSPVAKDGLCGPQHNNATCLGTDKQCCNGETWKCGDSKDDCRPGTCYSGACVIGGADIFSLHGRCGPRNGGLMCGGKWGDCCNFEGRCGTGDEFCGKDACESGNCTAPKRSWDDDEEKFDFDAWVGSGPSESCGGPEKHT
jgi:hypothetical protein